MLTMAGIGDCYTSARGHTRTGGNFAKAVFQALCNTYGYLSPDLWKAEVLTPGPFQTHTDFLAQDPKRRAIRDEDDRRY
jgi:small subunit ribosomal protein S2e